MSIDRELWKLSERFSKWNAKVDILTNAWTHCTTTILLILQKVIVNFLCIAKNKWDDIDNLFSVPFYLYICKIEPFLVTYPRIISARKKVMD